LPPRVAEDRVADDRAGCAPGGWVAWDAGLPEPAAGVLAVVDKAFDLSGMPGSDVRMLARLAAPTHLTRALVTSGTPSDTSRE
jgi:hypothetical protein